VPKTDNRTKAHSSPKKDTLPQGEGGSRDEVTAEPVEAVPTTSRRSTSTEKRTKVQIKPISEQVVAMSVELEREDPAFESTKTERLSAVELRAATDNSHFAEANPPIAAPGNVDHEVEVEVESETVGIVTRVRHVEKDAMHPH
jgi:hypothetical protein